MIDFNKKCQDACPMTNYRLSDIFRGKIEPVTKKYKNQIITSKDVKRWVHICWPKSIMDVYFNLTENYNNFSILSKITKTKMLNISSGTVLHIRAGDTIKNATKQWTKAIPHSKNNLRIYVFDRSYYKKIINQSRINPDAPLTIIASTIHNTGAFLSKNIIFDRNMEYLNLVYKLFKDSGFNTSLRVNKHTPDEDFAFMSNANIFIQGGGGYSDLVAKIVRINGGQVLKEL